MAVSGTLMFHKHIFFFFFSFQHLINWDYKEPASLLKVVTELLDEYKIYQEQIISKLSRLDFEYSSLCRDTNLTSDDVEIHVSHTEVGSWDVL